MKKQFTLMGIALLLVTAIMVTAAQPRKNEKRDQQKGQSKNKDKQDKNHGKNDDKGRSDDKSQKDNGDSDDDNNNGNGNGKNKDKGNSGKNDDKGRVNHDMKDGWKWNDVTFKDRKKFRNQDKVTICHKFNNNNEPAVTIRVSANAVKAHMGHGDIMGECPAVVKSTFSDKYIRNRTDYYNRLQNHNEQVSYSQSILDYAILRLTGSRQQLASLQGSNAPIADIQQKQATVVELEQNVSLLQTLLGVAANLVVSKLQ